MFTANKRTIGLLVLFLVVLFYAVGTGFPFFYRLLYVVLFIIAIGGVWCWLSLRGLEVRVSRTGDRGQVGGYLEGRVTVTNHTWLPKSWLEVTEAAGSALEPGGRGLSLDRQQVRSWRIDTFLARRGLFEGGQVRVVSQDPFGLFRMGRHFHDPHTYIVYPATEPLPNLDSRFAALPADSRLTRYFDQVTTDVASLRAWRPGDAYRRIHWPYTARMNTPMVKEFDAGLAAQFWLLLDLHRPSHHYPDVASGENRAASPADNTEELAVTAAASLGATADGAGAAGGAGGERRKRRAAAPRQRPRPPEPDNGIPGRRRGSQCRTAAGVSLWDASAPESLPFRNSDYSQFRPLMDSCPAGPKAAERHRCRRAD